MSSDSDEFEFDDDCDKSVDNQARRVLSSGDGNLVSLVSRLCDNDRRIDDRNSKQRLLVEKDLFGGDASDNAEDESSDVESGEDDDDDDLDWDDESDNQSSNAFVEQCAKETSEVDMIEEERVANKECERSEPTSSSVASNEEVTTSDLDDDHEMEELMKNGSPLHQRVWRSLKRNKLLNSLNNEKKTTGKRKRDLPQDSEQHREYGVDYSMETGSRSNTYNKPPPIEYKMDNAPDIDKIEADERRKKRIEDQKKFKESAALILKEARERANKPETLAFEADERRKKRMRKATEQEQEIAKEETANTMIVAEEEKESAVEAEVIDLVNESSDEEDEPPQKHSKIISVQDISEATKRQRHNDIDNDIRRMVRFGIYDFDDHDHNWITSCKKASDYMMEHRVQYIQRVGKDETVEQWSWTQRSKLKNGTLVNWRYHALLNTGFQF